MSTYELGPEIGRGGMGIVHRAVQTDLGRTVALKIIHPQLAHPGEAHDRFQREAQALMNLRHDHIVKVYDCGTLDGRFFYTMELLPGRTLESIIESEGALPVRRALSLLRQATDAIAHCHSLGMVHRDIKPNNMIVGEGDHLTVMDFGLVRQAEGPAMTTAGRILGTPRFIPPEVIDGASAGPAADVYALGLTLYEALAGQRAFDGMRLEILLSRIALQGPRPLDELVPSVPQEVRDLVDAAIRRDPAGRPTAAQWLTAMDTILVRLKAGKSLTPIGGRAAPRTPMRQQATSPRHPQSRRLHRRIRTGIVAGSLVLGAAMALLLLRAPAPTRSTDTGLPLASATAPAPSGPSAAATASQDSAHAPSGGIPASAGSGPSPASGASTPVAADASLPAGPASGASALATALAAPTGSSGATALSSGVSGATGTSVREHLPAISPEERATCLALVLATIARIDADQTSQRQFVPMLAHMTPDLMAAAKLCQDLARSASGMHGPLEEHWRSFVAAHPSLDAPVADQALMARVATYRTLTWFRTRRFTSVSVHFQEAARQDTVLLTALPAIMAPLEGRMDYSKEGLAMFLDFLRVLDLALTRTALSPADAGADLAGAISDSEVLAMSLAWGQWDDPGTRQSQQSIAAFRAHLGALAGPAGEPLGDLARSFWDWGAHGTLHRNPRLAVSQALADIDALRPLMPAASAALSDLATQIQRDWKTATLAPSPAPSPAHILGGGER